MAAKVCIALPAGRIMNLPGLVRVMRPMSRPSKSVRPQLSHWDFGDNNVHGSSPL